jgi:hypothetical protein
MPKLKYAVKLTNEEKGYLLPIVKTGIAPSRDILHANILLSTDDNRIPKLSVVKVVERCNSTTTTVQTIRKNYVLLGLEATIKRKKRETPPIEPKITGDVEARIIALSCSKPPDGYSRWTVRLLADKTVELGYIDSISYVSVSTVLKKRITASSS